MSGKKAYHRIMTVSRESCARVVCGRKMCCGSSNARIVFSEGWNGGNVAHTALGSEMSFLGNDDRGFKRVFGCRALLEHMSQHFNDKAAKSNGICEAATVKQQQLMWCFGSEMRVVCLGVIQIVCTLAYMYKESYMFSIGWVFEVIYVCGFC